MTAPTAPNASTAQARVVVDELARGGIRHVVVCPGSRSAALAIAVHEDPRLTVHVHPDERSAAFVALGIGRATGVPAVVVVTSGTAVANLLPAVVESDHAGVPLLLLTADRPPELRGTGANQTIDQQGLLGPGPRWAVELGVAEDRVDAVRMWRSVVARAVAVAGGATGASPGPVHLNVPTREPTVPIAADGRVTAPPFTAPLIGRDGSAPWLGVTDAPSGVDPASVERLVARISGVERGLILVGAPVGGNSVAPAAVDALAAVTGWPVVAEVLAPARSATAALDAGAWLLADEAFAARHRPEIVLTVGRPTLHGAWSGWAGRAATAILVEPFGGVHDAARALSELVVADPTRLLTEVAARLGGAAPADVGWAREWAAADAAAVAVRDATLAAGPLTGLKVARRVLEAVPAGVPLVASSSLPIRDLDLVGGRRDVSVHANRGAAGIDGTVGTVLGVGLGTGGDVWALVGDLALLHDANGFLLQPGSVPPVATMVVVDNRGGRIFEDLPPARHAPAFERLFVAPPTRDLTLLARFHGLVPLVVDDVAGLDRLGAAPPGERSGTLVIVTIEPGVDRRSRSELRERIGTAVAGGRP